MTDDYTLYTVSDFLRDDTFIQWQLTHTDEYEKYWEEQLSKSPEIEPILTQAIQKFKAVNFNNYSLTEETSTRLLQNIVNNIRREKRQRKIVRKWIPISAAAAILLLVGISSLLFLNTQPATENSTMQITQSSLTTTFEVDNVTLITQDSVISLENNAQITYDAQGNANIETTEKNRIEEPKTPIRNKLIVPYGKRSTLTLADGSKMWINSGTTVEFPNVFDNTREIKVIGEVYIEVEKDRKRPFIVKTNHFDVQVLGTKFNISAYQDDKNQSVALVEGSVNVTTEKNDCIKLVPNDLLSLTDTDTKLQQVNINEYISWKNGWLQLNSSKLCDITQRLSRYYNKSIVCDRETMQRTCSGKLELSDNLEQVLDIISENMNAQCIHKGEQIIIVSK